MLTSDKPLVGVGVCWVKWTIRGSDHEQFLFAVVDDGVGRATLNLDHGRAPAREALFFRRRARPIVPGQRPCVLGHNEEDFPPINVEVVASDCPGIDGGNVQVVNAPEKA
jgi:hypothetical protein